MDRGFGDDDGEEEEGGWVRSLPVVRFVPAARAPFGDCVMVSVASRASNQLHNPTSPCSHAVIYAVSPFGKAACGSAGSKPSAVIVFVEEVGQEGVGWGELV